MLFHVQVSIKCNTQGFDRVGDGQFAVWCIEVVEPDIYGKGLLFRLDEEEFGLIGIELQVVVGQPGLYRGESAVQGLAILS